MMATKMGAFAVDMLLEGRSNIVICEKKSETVAVDINYALVIDRMYKGKLKEGDLEPFSVEDIDMMKREIEEKKTSIRETYDLSREINL